MHDDQDQEQGLATVQVTFTEAQAERLLQLAEGEMEERPFGESVYGGAVAALRRAVHGEGA